MKYISTRGKAEVLNFEQAVLTGLARDGGLYVPYEIPHFTTEQIKHFASLTYTELALEIMLPFVGECITKQELKDIIDQSYNNFNHAAIAPINQIGNREYILELFHGPTIAFKDFALQFLGRLLDFFLSKNNIKGIVLAATSGDTGSAAIEGCKHSKNLDIFIMHPEGLVSEVQRKQMTSVDAKNVFNIAIKGNFDDCQELVKESFAQQEFLKQTRAEQLIAVNSINFARIMAQIVYYFYAAVQLGAPYNSVSFSVPTGNFGDIYAGFLAYKMGLPINKLIVATNKNDILDRFFSKNSYTKATLQASLSPSMDIMVSSNFERLLFEYHARDGQMVSNLMQQFKQTGSLSVEKDILIQIQQLFSSSSSTDEEICKTIKQTYEESSYHLDPHTATAVKATKEHKTTGANVILATAHPAKFPESSIKSGLQAASLPQHLANLLSKPEQYEILNNSIDNLHSFIIQKTKL